MALCSKVISRLAEELIVSKHDRSIVLINPLTLLDKLGHAWSHARKWKKFQAVRFAREGDELLPWLRKSFASCVDCKWMVSGASSATRYAVMAQAGPMEIIVSDLGLAKQCTQAIPEQVPAFSEATLIEYGTPIAFEGMTADNAGIHWAGLLQSWLELQGGDSPPIAETG
jgi:hypothetical protein